MNYIGDLVVLAAGLCFLGEIHSGAATFTNLHNFSALSPSGANGDGANSASGLLLSGNVLYGETSYGGAADSGTIFKVNTDGTGFSRLYSFTAQNYQPSTQLSTNGDGANPIGDLVLSGSVLYGTTYNGGSAGGGTLFKVNVDGTGFLNLHTFTASTNDLALGVYTNSDGSNPHAGLVFSGSMLYGTAQGGGLGSSGTIFAVNTNGTGFTTLHNFAPVNYSASIRAYTNRDGASPYAGLVLSGGVLYGNTYGGGNGGAGTVFQVNTDGTGFSTLHHFAALKFSPALVNYTNIDGANPYGGLIQSGSTLYGTTDGGGGKGDGSVFKVNTDGTGFSTLYTFLFADDGANPEGGLVLSSNTLYGTCKNGGAVGYGTVYSVNTDGTGFGTLYNFSELIPNAATNNDTNSDGANPYADLIFADGTIYGTTMLGGTGSDGTVFALNVGTAPAERGLRIELLGTSPVLSWSGASSSLQSAPVVAGPYTNVANATSPYTNSLPGSQRFFRLQTP